MITEETQNLTNLGGETNSVLKNSLREQNFRFLGHPLSKNQLILKGKNK